MPKKPLTPAQINDMLKFDPAWFKDPATLFRQHLDRDTLKQIEQAKIEFGKQINTIVKNRQG